MPMNDAQIEAVCRAICKERDEDPDALVMRSPGAVPKVPVDGFVRVDATYPMWRMLRAFVQVVEKHIEAAKA